MFCLNRSFCVLFSAFRRKYFWSDDTDLVSGRSRQDFGATADSCARMTPFEKFERLDDDHAEEAAMKNVGTKLAIKESHGLTRACAAVAVSSLPLLLAHSIGSYCPHAVADAMGKSAIASSVMLLCSLIGYGTSVPIRLLAAFQHLAAGLLVSSVAVELVPPIMEAPNDFKSNVAIIGGFVGGTVAFFALGAYCGEVDEDGEEDGDVPNEAAAALSLRDERVVNEGAPAGATPRTPRGLTKIAHVQRARALQAPPYPAALVAAVVVDSAVDGMLIGLASASATETASAGLVLAIALAIEMGFTGLAYAATLHKQPSSVGLLSIATPPFVLLGASFVGASTAAQLVGYPTAHVALLSFGATALLYLVVVELLREAHEAMGDDAVVVRVIEAQFFVGFFSAVMLERALES